MADGTGSPFYAARIVERREVSSELWVIRVDPGGEFTFRPGQYATLGITAGGKRFERPYSIASAPHEPFLEFFLELVPGGALTPRLYQLAVGDSFTLRKTAKGRFMTDIADRRSNRLLVATVTGVAPFVSYIRSMYRDWQAGAFTGGRICVLQGASRSQELGYAAEIGSLAGEAPWLKYVPAISRPWEDAEWSAETGRVDDIVRKYTDGWKLEPDQTEVYLCGNPGMIRNTRNILLRAGWPAEAINSEAFFPAVAVESGSEK